MDFFKSQYDRILQQLAGLTPSQKMLSAALVTIMVMTVLWWGKYAATPEYEPLLTQRLSAEEITQISMQLKSAGVEHNVTGTQILVPKERRLDALAMASWGNAMPQDTVSGFDDMIKQMTPWDGASRQGALFNHGKEVTLQRIISHFPGVASATVLIDPVKEFKMNRELSTVASVDVRMKDQSAPPPKRLAEACAQLVSGAQSGLKPSSVKVVINGRPVPVQAAENGSFATSDILEKKQAAELHEKTKLEEHLDIPGLRVTVNVKVNSVSETVASTTVDKDKSFSAETKITTKSNEQTRTAPPRNEPGAGPNVGMSIEQKAAATPDTSTETEETVELQNLPATTTTNQIKPAGDPIVTSASVRVPRSYIVLHAKNGDPTAKEPDAAAYEKAMAEVLPKIKAAVIVATGLPPDGAVEVEAYIDLMPAPRDLQMAQASGVTSMLGSHVKEIALGSLALVSLFMMSMIVRKGSPVTTPALATVSTVTPHVLSGSDDFAGEATGHNPALDGMELDDDSLKAQQMLSQVSSLVGESPDTAAQLIKRWMNQR